MLRALLIAVPAIVSPDRDVGCLDDGSETCAKPTKDSVLLQMDREANLHRSASEVSILKPEWALGFEPLAADLMVNESMFSDLGLLQEMEEELRAGPSQTELQHFQNVKAERARGFRCPDGTYYPPNNGEFRFDCRLWRAAKLWSRRMATEGFEGHRYGGSTSCQRTEAQGFPKMRGCGENLALGQRTSLEAIAELKRSKEHCKNFFEKQYNKLGCGYFYNANAKYRWYWTDSFGAWHHGPDESCIGGSPAPTPAPGCADIDTMNCGHYKNQGLCATSSNVQSHCKETCGIGNCGRQHVPAPAPAPGGSCQDTTGSCPHYRNQGMCANNANVRTHCKKTCGLCGGAPAPAPVPGGSCQDTTSSCDHYKRQGMCASYANVRTHCKKTCGLCR